MQHFTFGRNNGLRVSALALGAGTFGTRWGYGAAPEDVPRIFDTFADAGGTFIDTAASYQVGEAEENLGRLLDGRRDDFTVATKFAIGGPDGTGVLQTGNGRRAMFRSVEGSLRRLGTDYIDLLWVHFPDFVTPLDEIVRGLDDLATAGKILYAGLSNFPAWMTARAATLAELRGAIPISGVQLEYSLVERSADRENLPMAESLGLGTWARKRRFQTERLGHGRFSRRLDEAVLQLDTKSVSPHATRRASPRVTSSVRTGEAEACVESCRNSPEFEPAHVVEGGDEVGKCTHSRSM